MTTPGQHFKILNVGRLKTYNNGLKNLNFFLFFKLSIVFFLENHYLGLLNLWWNSAFKWTSERGNDKNYGL